MEFLITLFFLTFLEIVLGVDNVIFIALIVNQFPKHLRARMRFIGLSLSLVFRLLFLAFIGVLLKLKEPILTYNDLSFSFKDLLILVGGLFLIYKATMELHGDIKGASNDKKPKVHTTVFMGILQIIFVDIVFSFDSLITAVGLTKDIFTIAFAIIVSIIFMLAFSAKIAEFIEKYPTLKTLAVAFILLIGVFLVMEGFSVEAHKEYLYFAMGFSLAIEFINIYIRNKQGKN